MKGKKKKDLETDKLKNKIKSQIDIINNLLKPLPDEKLEFKEAKMNIDLEQNGKYPWGLMAVHNGEGVCDIKAELLDGQIKDFKLNVWPVEKDYFGNSFKHFKYARRFSTPAIPIILKKIIKCSAKKVYIIY